MEPQNASLSPRIAGAAPPPPPALHTPAATVLVVDDEEGVRRAVRAWLQNSGFVVAEAADGAGCLRQIRARPGRFGAVVLDLELPRVAGVELLDFLARSVPSTPVILISGHDAPCAMHLINNRPFSWYLQKPFPMQALADILLSALGRSTH